MGRTWSTPSHRNTKTPQVEICDFCGALVGAADRVLATAEGAAGMWVCKEHEVYATTPSYNDLGGAGTLIGPQSPLLPHSGGFGLDVFRDTVSQLRINIQGDYLLINAEDTLTVG